MNDKNTILLICDQETELQMLKDMLGDEYKLITADHAQTALNLMRQYARQLGAAFLYVSAAGKLNGHEVLRCWHEEAEIHSIPMIAASRKEDADIESDSLKMGVWDFIYLPCDPALVCLRVKKAVELSGLLRLKQDTCRRGYDELTGIYNQSRFLRRTRDMLRHFPKQQFAFIHMDINRFHLVNQFYGIREADSLLKYMAGLLVIMSENIEHFTYGRYLADVFCFCMPYEGEGKLIRLIEQIREDINRYEIDHVLVPVFGIYIINEEVKNIDAVSDCANLASKHCKGNYIQNYAFYKRAMSDEIVHEQQIINMMKAALVQEQFVLYIQPKYDLHSNRIDGGEVLVRWKHPEKGMMNPGDFIPLFERNGFIMKLDYYIWEQSCRIIRRWLDEDRNPFPISVNISRVSLYNPQLAEIIIGLVKKYEVPTHLLHLELTESACTNNTQDIKDTMARLRDYGFCILMDDFGSGYSSLSALKEIAVDILKIDMQFISGRDMSSRGKNILASVVRMAKWLNMSVIVEGVEKESQVAFLKSIGCEFVQGFYFAKPMPVDEYERFAFGGLEFQKELKDRFEKNKDIPLDESSEMDLIFSNMLQAVALYEYVPGEGTIDRTRANDSYHDLMGDNDPAQMKKGMQNTVDVECRRAVIQAFEAVSRSHDVAQCEFHRTSDEGSVQWIEMKLKYINTIGNRNVIFATMGDITNQKEIERELHKYRKAIIASESKVETILIVDDIKMNRQILRNMFESEYNILEAADGREALDIVYKNIKHIDLILLDVMMPVMDGREFLEKKSEDLSIVDIPVVVITSDDSPQQQINALSLGANDYVVKPFIPEVVIRRVCNVLESQKRVGEVLQGTEDSSRKENCGDYPTGLYNRNEAGQIMREVLHNQQAVQALFMVKILNIRQIEERYGRAAVGKSIQDFAGRLRSCFRKSNILARYSGDEFMVSVIDVPSKEFIEKKCAELMQDEVKLEYSIGIAVAAGSDKGQESFMELISHADKALSEARHKGVNKWHIYESIL